MLSYLENLHCRENLPSHFKFKEYCPQVFRNLRDRFGIDDQDYLVRVRDAVMDGSNFLSTYGSSWESHVWGKEILGQYGSLLFYGDRHPQMSN